MQLITLKMLIKLTINYSKTCPIRVNQNILLIQLVSKGVLCHFCICKNIFTTFTNTIFLSSHWHFIKDRSFVWRCPLFMIFLLLYTNFKTFLSWATFALVLSFWFEIAAKFENHISVHYWWIWNYKRYTSNLNICPSLFCCVIVKKPSSIFQTSHQLNFCRLVYCFILKQRGLWMILT